MADNDTGRYGRQLASSEGAPTPQPEPDEPALDTGRYGRSSSVPPPQTYTPPSYTPLSMPGPIVNKARHAPSLEPAPPRPLPQMKSVNPWELAAADPKRWVDDNLVKDAMTTMEGVGKLGALVHQRYIEQITPQGLYDKSTYEDAPNPIMGAIHGLSSRPAIRLSDFPAIGKFLQGTAEYYRDLGKDIISDPQAINTRLYRTPITTGSDLAGAAGLAKSGLKAGVRYAARKLGKEAALDANIIAARTHIDNALENTILKLPGIKHVRDWFRLNHYYAEILKDLDVKQRAKFVGLFDNITKLYDDAERAVIKAGLDPKDMIVAAEFRDIDKALQFRQIPKVQLLFNASAHGMDLLGEALVKAGAFSEADLLMGKYGPYAHARVPSGVPLTPDVLLQAKAELDSFGQNPVHLAVAYHKRVKDALALKRGFFTSGVNVGRKVDREIEQFQHARTANRGAGDRARPGIADHYLDVWSATFLEGTSFLAWRELFQELLKHKQTISTGPVAKVHIVDAIENMGRGVGMNAQSIEAFIKKYGIQNIEVDKHFAGMLNEILGVKGSSQSLNARLTAAVVKIMLGTNVHWALGQGIQNQMILPWAMFKSPQDIVPSLLAYRIAMDPKTRKLADAHLPDLLGEHTQMPMQGHIAHEKMVWEDRFQKMNLPQKVGQSSAEVAGRLTACVNWYIERVFGLTNRGDNYARLVLFSYKLMSEADKSPALRVPLRDAMNMQARHMQMEAAMIDDLNMKYNRVKGTAPKYYKLYIERAAEDCYAYLGKYDALTASQWAAMRRTFPFFLWWLHAWSIMMKLPESPLKVALFTKLTAYMPTLDPAIMPEYLRRKGVVPRLDQYGNWLLGPDGYPVVDYGGNWVPITQVPELMEQMGQFSGFTDVKDPAGYPLTNVGISGIIVILAGINVQNMKPFIQDKPSLTPRHGNYFNAQNERIQNAWLPLPNAAERVLLPTWDVPIRETLAFPYQPTAFTNITDKAAKPSKAMNGYAHQWGHGEPLGLARLWALNAFKAKPMEMRMTLSEERNRKIWEHAESLKAHAYNRHRQDKPVPVWDWRSRQQQR